MAVRCCILVGSLHGLKNGQVEESGSVDAAVHSLDYWMAQVRACATLQPLEKSTSIICTDETRLGTVAWARLRGISENFICTSANLASRGSDVALAVVDASLVYGPYFSLARLLQLAQVRAKDIVAFTEITPQTLACQDCHPVFLSSPLGPCPRMSLSSGGEHQHHTAPLYVLTPESAATLASGGGQVDPAALLATQQAFGSHVPQVWLAEGWAQEQANIRAKVMSHQHAAVKGLPERFRQAEWDYSMVKKEHPVYATSSHCFGSKKPSQHELPESWSGIKGGLAAFGSGKEKHSGLSTGIRMSKVHQSLDGWC